MVKRKSKKNPKKKRPLVREIIASQDRLIKQWESLGVTISDEFKNMKRKDRKLLKNQQLSRYAIFIDLETGEFARGTKAIKFAHEFQQQSTGEDIIIERFIREMTEIFSINAPHILSAIKAWLQNSLQYSSKSEVAKMLQKGAGDGTWPTWEDISDTTRIAGKLSKMLDELNLSQRARDDIEDDIMIGGWDENTPQYYIGV